MQQQCEEQTQNSIYVEVETRHELIKDHATLESETTVKPIRVLEVISKNESMASWIVNVIKAPVVIENC